MSRKILLTPEQITYIVQSHVTRNNLKLWNESITTIKPHFVVHEDRCKNTMEERFEGYVVELE